MQTIKKLHLRLVEAEAKIAELERASPTGHLANKGITVEVGACVSLMGACIGACSGAWLSECTYIA